MKHRSVLKQKNKKHKSGHSQKNQFKDPKANPSVPNLQTEKGQKDRRNQIADARREKKMMATKVAQKVGSKNGPPKVVGILPCSQSADPAALLSIINFQPEVEGFMLPAGVINGGQFNCRILPLPIERSIDILLDVGKVADIIILLFFFEEPLDEWGSLAISILKAIGLPQIIPVVASPSGQPIPRSSLVNYRNYIQKDLPDVERVLPLASEEDMNQFVRFLSVTIPRTISWKENRPNMLIQNYSVNEAQGTIELFGYLRGAPLNVHQVVTVPYMGDYYIGSANDIVPAEELRHPLIYETGENDLADAEIHPPRNIDSFDAIEEVRNEFQKLDVNDQTGEMPPNEEEDFGGEEDFDEDLDEDDRLAQEAEFARAQEELENKDIFWNDETILLRERFRKYRGLSNFKNSQWDPHESLPPQYAQIFEFANFPRLAEAVIAEQEKGEIPPGSRLKLILLNGSNDIKAWSRVPEGRPLIMFGLFRNETRLTVINATFFNRGPPILSKSPLLAICGFRHLWINPLFSEYDVRSPKHIYMKVVDSGKEAIASFIAPAMMQNCPVTYFKDMDGLMNFVGTGSIKTVDPSRMIIKKKIITGNPYRALGKSARVTRMFYNKEDIIYFRKINLKTRLGKTGHIVEPIGLKGHFKAKFNDILQQHDTIQLILYKRVFPKNDTKPATF